MINKTRFRVMLRNHKSHQGEAAVVCDMSRATMSSKVSGTSEFKRNEIVAMVKFYNLSPRELLDIFFPEVGLVK